MKQLTKRLLMACLVGATLYVCASARAQEWSAAQKEVWKNVQAYWALDAAHDLEGFLAYFHEDYLGWSYEDALPADKATLKKWLEHRYKTSKVLVYDIKPTGIKIHGNTAFVHYYWSDLIKDSEGKEKERSGRWTDILIKEGDKWLLIGDHGGRSMKDKE